MDTRRVQLLRLRQTTSLQAEMSEFHLGIEHTPDEVAAGTGAPFAVPNEGTLFRLALAAPAGYAPFIFPITFGSDSPTVCCRTAKLHCLILVLLHATCFALLFSAYHYAYDYVYAWMINASLLSSTLSITPEIFPLCRGNACRMKFSVCLMGASLFLSLFHLFHRTCPVPLCVAVLVHQMACFLFLLFVLKDSFVHSADPSAAAERLSAINEHELQQIPDIEFGMEV